MTNTTRTTFPTHASGLSAGQHFLVADKLGAPMMRLDDSYRKRLGIVSSAEVPARNTQNGSYFAVHGCAAIVPDGNCEAYRVTILAARTDVDGMGEKTWRTLITIAQHDPIEEVADKAHEAFYAEHGDNWDILDTSETAAK